MTTIYQFRIFDHSQQIDQRWIDHVPIVGKEIVVKRQKRVVFDVCEETLIAWTMFHSDWKPNSPWGRGFKFSGNGMTFMPQEFYLHARKDGKCLSD